MDAIQVLPLFEQSAKTTLLETVGNASDLRSRALAWHGLAGQEHEGASAEAVKYLKQLADETKDDPLILAYLGSAYIMKARDTWFIGTKIDNVRSGLKILTSAVEAAPDSFQTRALRATTAYHLPDIFDYRSVIIQDLERMLTIIGRDETAPVAGSPEHGRVLAALAKIHLIQDQPQKALPLISRLEAEFSREISLSRIANQLRKAAEQ